MKRVFLVVCILLISWNGFSQLKWDVRVGANVSDYSKGETDVRIGWKAGVGVEYAFSDLFALRPSLYYSLKGAAAEGHKFSMNRKFTQKLSYVELPVLAVFRFKVTQGFALAVNAGPYFAARVGKKVAVGGHDARAFDMGVDAGLDFLVHSFVVGVGAQYGLTGLTGGGGEPHNVNYSLTFGYRF